jgi:hypothetical protein
VARTFTADFETGPDGATMTAANTGYDTVSSGATGTRTFDAANALLGSFAGKYSVGATSTNTLMRKTFTSTNLRYFRMYVKFDAPAGILRRLARIRLVSSVIANIQLSVGGKFQMTDAASGVWTSTLTPSAGTWYRLEWMVNATTNKQRLLMFTGANLHGTVPDEDSGDQTYTQGPFDNIEQGICAATTNWAIWFDSVANDDATYPGPALISGAGALSPTPATLSGPGAVQTSGPGALTAQPASLASTGTLAALGDGALTPTAAALTGAGSLLDAGTGALTAPSPALSTPGQLQLGGPGELTAVPALLTASGDLATTGDGTLLAAAATLSAPGAIVDTSQWRDITATALLQPSPWTAELVARGWAARLNPTRWKATL